MTEPNVFVKICLPYLAQTFQKKIYLCLNWASVVCVLMHFLNQCTIAFLNMIIVGSLVQAHNQSTSLLHPLFVQSREMSLESGYISHEGGGSSRSTPSSPKKFAHFLQTKKRHSRAQLSQSASEDDGTTSPTIVTKSRILENPQQHYTIREKRQKFQK
jgi:hypothetical protein